MPVEDSYSRCCGFESNVVDLSEVQYFGIPGSSWYLLLVPGDEVRCVGQDDSVLKEQDSGLATRTSVITRSSRWPGFRGCANAQDQFTRS